MVVKKLLIQDGLRIHFTTVQNNTVVLALIFDRITVRTTEKQVVPIEFQILVAAVGIQMLYLYTLEFVDFA